MAEGQGGCVSIPFIAGQWSLPRPPYGGRGGRRQVSIPFIAGQWSLLSARRHHTASHVVSQSPSLRGSGRFDRSCQTFGHSTESLNPLHCGAVVASSWWLTKDVLHGRVSIPFIAGQWSLHVVENDPDLQGVKVSIPFIAGQWSLHGQGMLDALARRCLNPLHCGAVVASCPLAARRGGKEQVSIPFIAGQWSLPFAAGSDLAAVMESQSPSLRGSGRFTCWKTTRPSRAPGLNPLHCGAVVASRRRERP